MSLDIGYQALPGGSYKWVARTTGQQWFHTYPSRSEMVEASVEAIMRTDPGTEVRVALQQALEADKAEFGGSLSEAFSVLPDIGFAALSPRTVEQIRNGELTAQDLTL